MTNLKIEKSNSSKSASNKNIRKINIESIQLIHKHTNVCLQNKLDIIKIKTNLFQRLKDFATFFFDDIVFLFSVRSDLALVTYRMFLLISQDH